MKKINKVLLAGLGLIAGQAIFNNYIFNKAEAEDEDKSDKHFDWKFGRVNYTVKGTGEPLLFIHEMGSGFSLNEWNANINIFSKHFTVYAIDLLGYGFSDKPKITYNAYLYTSLVNDFIRKIIKEPTSIVASGNSSTFGILASLFYPEMINKVVMVSPKEIVSNNEDCPYKNKAKRFVLEMPIIGDTIFNIKNSKFATSKLINSLTNKDTSIKSKLIDDFYLSSHRKGRNSKFVSSALETGYLDTNLGENLNKLEKPILIIWSEKDNNNPIKKHPALNKSNVYVSLDIFDSGGSLPHMENPKEFYYVCSNFLI